MRKLKLDELNRLDVDAFKSADKIPIIVVLDNIRSALNVGSVFRTSDAYAIEKVVLCGISATPPNKEINKTAIGAHASVAWSYEEDIKSYIESLDKQNHLIIGVEQTDQSLMLQQFESAPEKTLVLIFGNEVEGLSETILPLLHHSLEIPQYGTKHSLNISVCAGIVINHFSNLLRG